MQKRIGIDVGGVIIPSAEEGSKRQAMIHALESGEEVEDTASFFNDNYLEVQPVEGAIEGIHDIVDGVGADNVFIVSKCGKQIQDKTVKWMLAHKFFVRTGMHAHNVHFCLKREDKAPIAKGLQLRYFVDDRVDVLGYMSDIVDNRIIFMPDEKTFERAKKLEHANVGLLTFEYVADNWQEVIEIVMNT